jgi:methylated-DNA-[protein]-cysteine S-methyltransferase
VGQVKDIERALQRSAAGLPEDAPPELARRAAKGAAEAGVVDVAYAPVDSPLGRLTVAATRRGLVRIAYPSPDPDAALERLARLISPRLLEAPARLDEVRRELDEYFEGRRTAFEVPIDWSLTKGFGRRVLRETARIHYGKVRTYTEVATRAGSPRAVRAAGNALGANPMPIVVPCHRVLRIGGNLGGYGGGLDRKEFLLKLEGALPEA